MLKRTKNCGEISLSESGKEVVVNGWVDRTRNLGGIIFISLRDRYGKIQAIVSPDKKEIYDIADSLRNEDVVALKGVVRERPEESVKKDTDGGLIELEVVSIEMISKAETPPIYVNIASDTSEESRLKYRYLDLRTDRMKKNIVLRHKVISSVRDFFNSQDFLEIDTPSLSKSTPEGARDFLVPARLKPGKFYALPQSPQLFKQLLMISGFDRYYQIAKCFRDEDLRADRQPEFTQIDYEMSFVEEEDVITITEMMLKKVFKDSLGLEIETPFLRMEFSQAMEKYGSDKPDLRFGLELKELTEIFKGTQFKIISSVL
jgi:aspartyl-tRNA synthetase